MTLIKGEMPACEVCDSRPSVGVASVPGVPVSVAFCAPCLAAGAYPLWILVANTADLGGIEHAAPWWRNMVIATLVHLNVTWDEFNRRVAAEIAATQVIQKAEEIVAEAPRGPE